MPTNTKEAGLEELDANSREKARGVAGQSPAVGVAADPAGPQARGGSPPRTLPRASEFLAGSSGGSRTRSRGGALLPYHSPPMLL
jgi:hypothetical protein